MLFRSAGAYSKGTLTPKGLLPVKSGLQPEGRHPARGADYLSILLLALSLGCLEYTLEEGPRWGWFDDATLTTTAWVALLCGVAFVIRTLRHPQPVMDLRALQDRTFSLGCYFSFMAGVGIFATIYLTPLYLGSVRGFSALEIGLAVFSTGLFQVMSIPFYSWLANRVDLRWLLMAPPGAASAYSVPPAPGIHGYLVFSTPAPVRSGCESLLPGCR